MGDMQPAVSIQNSLRHAIAALTNPCQAGASVAPAHQASNAVAAHSFLPAAKLGHAATLSAAPACLQSGAPARQALLKLAGACQIVARSHPCTLFGEAEHKAITAAQSYNVAVVQINLSCMAGVQTPPPQPP